jgi:hypothetical protein
MHEETPPADGDDFHEELVRRNKKSELLPVWEELMRKHFLPKKGARKLAMLVALRQRLKSQDPEIRFEYLTRDVAPRSWEMVEQYERDLLQAELEGDWRFLRKVSDAVKLVKTGKIRPFFDIDYALQAWWMLYGELGYGELGQIPGEHRLRENVDKLRKRDGKAKISTRRWKELLKKLKPLPLSRE